MGNITYVGDNMKFKKFFVEANTYGESRSCFLKGFVALKGARDHSYGTAGLLKELAGFGKDLMK
jgi:hypothetical protein